MRTGFWWGNLRKRALSNPMRRREDNIKIDLQELGWGHGLDSSDLG